MFLDMPLQVVLVLEVLAGVFTHICLWPSSAMAVSFDEVCSHVISFFPHLEAFRAEVVVRIHHVALLHQVFRKLVRARETVLAEGADELTSRCEPYSLHLFAHHCHPIIRWLLVLCNYDGLFLFLLWLLLLQQAFLLLLLLSFLLLLEPADVLNNIEIGQSLHFIVLVLQGLVNPAVRHRVVYERTKRVLLEPSTEALSSQRADVHHRTIIGWLLAMDLHQVGREVAALVHVVGTQLAKVPWTDPHLVHHFQVLAVLVRFDEDFAALTADDGFHHERTCTHNWLLHVVLDGVDFLGFRDRVLLAVVLLQEVLRLLLHTLPQGMKLLDDLFGLLTQTSLSPVQSELILHPILHNRPQG